LLLFYYCKKWKKLESKRIYTIVFLNVLLLWVQCTHEPPPPGQESAVAMGKTLGTYGGKR